MGLDLGIRMAVQFQRLTAFGELPGSGAVDPEVEALLLGTDVDALRSLRERMRRSAQATAASLLTSPAIGRAVAALPQDATVALAGDSLTADHQSWAEIIRAVMAGLRDDVHVINLGRSGDTTMDLVRRLPGSLGTGTPHLLVILIGSNDACRNMPVPGSMFVSDRETAANVAALADIARARAHRFFWVSPPPLLESVVASFPVFQEMGIRYLADDVARKAQIVLARPEPALDLWDAFGGHELAGLLMSDGLHLDAAGHAIVAERVLLQLA